MNTRIKKLGGLIACIAMIGLSPIVNADPKYPVKPVTMMVPYPAGGPSDVSARILSGPIGEALGERVVVENLGGATGTIAAMKVLNANADGYYIFQGTQNELILPVLTNNTVKFKSEEFEAVHPITVTSLVLLVKKDLPVTTVEEFVTLAKERSASNPLTYGTVGVGSLYHLVTERLSKDIDSELTHIPYKGTAPVMQDLAGGQIDFAIQAFQTSMQAMEDEGRFKIIAVLSSEKPGPLKNKPSITENATFKDYHYQSIAGYYVKKGTPDPIKNILNKAIAKALQTESVVNSLEADGRVVSQAKTLDEANTIYLGEIEKYKEIIKATDFKPSN